MKYFIIFAIIIFSTINAYPGLMAAEQQPNFKAPETLKEAETAVKGLLNRLPEAMRAGWEEALVIWGKTFKWFQALWKSYADPWIQKVWNKTQNFLRINIEKKKPEIKKEFQKEKQEMKQEIPKVSKSLWQRFKELIEF